MTNLYIIATDSLNKVVRISKGVHNAASARPWGCKDQKSVAKRLAEIKKWASEYKVVVLPFESDEAALAHCAELQKGF